MAADREFQHFSMLSGQKLPEQYLSEPLLVIFPGRQIELCTLEVFAMVPLHLTLIKSGYLA